MFGIKILTRRKFERLLQSVRDEAFSNAIREIVKLCEQKKKIHLDTVEMHGDGNEILDSVFLGCEIGVKAYPVKGCCENGG
jgi:hypothetical protein